MSVSVELDLDQILSEVYFISDKIKIIKYLEDEGYVINKKECHDDKGITDEKVLNYICDKNAIPYTSSKEDKLNAFKVSILNI